MSKRGYNVQSRYNPNKISSYTIKATNFLKSERLIDFYPGFFDRKKKISRLTRIKASKTLTKIFSDSLLTIEKKINHPKREYLIFKDKNNSVIEYNDNFQTHEIRELLLNYNNLISKSLIDIPTYENKTLTRFDKKKIVISETNSQVNLFCYNDLRNIHEFSGCWWDKFDINLLHTFQRKLLINNQLTCYVDMNDYFNFFLRFKFNSSGDFFSKTFASEHFNHTQKCKIIEKAINLKSYKSLIRSLTSEKKNFFVDEKIHINEIQKKIDLLIKNNQNISEYFFKGNNVNWRAFVSDIFLDLLKIFVPSNISIFLIHEKIYFPLSFQDRVLASLEKIFHRKLNFKNQDIKCYPCDDYNFKSKGFFSKIISRKSEFSSRYLNRLSNLKLK